MANIKAYAKNLSSYFGASLIPMLLNLLVNPWIAKNMLPEDYAITGYYSSYSSLIGPIIVFYLIHFYIKEYFKLNQDDRLKLFATIGKALIWFSGVVSVICFVLIFIFLNYFNKISLPVSPYLALSVFSLPLTGLLNLQLAEYKLEKNTHSYFILSVSNGVLSVLISCLYVVIFKWGALGKLLAIFSVNFFFFLFLLYKLRHALFIKTDRKDYITIFKFCLPLALSAMLGYFTTGFTTTYLESIGNNTEYGIYVVGVSIATYLTTFATAINNTFQPDIYEAIIKYQLDRFAKFCILQIALISFVVILFILCAPFAIRILTAGRYMGSTIYAQIVSLSTITSSIYYLINNYSIATGRPKIYLSTTIIGSIIIVCTLPLIVNRFQFIGGCWFSVFSFLLFALTNLCLLKVRKQHN